MSVIVKATRIKALPRFTLCRSEEHTSELQSRFELVCRLLLEKKKLTLDRLLATRPENGRAGAISTQLDRIFQLAQSQPDFVPRVFSRELQIFAEVLAVPGPWP